jgi:hypothetical protein
MTTWNPSDKSGVTLSGADLTVTGYGGVRATTSRAAGKYYFEISADLIPAHAFKIGLGNASTNLACPPCTDDMWILCSSGYVKAPGEAEIAVDAIVAGDVIRIAVDLDAGKLWFGVDGAWLLSGDPESGASPALTFTPATLYPLFLNAGDEGFYPTVTAHFMADDLSCYPPTGFDNWDGTTGGGADCGGGGGGGGGVTVTPSWAMDLDVVETTVTPSWGLSLAVTGLAEPSWPLSLAVYDVAAMAASRAHVWSVGLTVAGVDWSGRLTGPVRIDAESGAAALADFTVRLPTGAFDPADWTRAEVRLDYLFQGATRVAMFAGWVDTIDLDDARKTLALRCVDRRLAMLLAASREQIAAWLPGSIWSAGWFDDDADSLRYAEDRLSTLQADFDVDAHGTPRLTQWAAKASPDWTITLPEEDSVSWAFARAADLVHRVDIGFRYRFTRLRQREARLKYVFDLYDMFNDLVAMPTSDLVEEAIQSAGWDVLDDPIYKRPAEWYEQAGPVFWICDAVNGVLEATARLGKRFAQSVEESYALTLSVAESGIDARQTRKLSGALEAPFDVRAWEDDPAAAPALAMPGLAIETAQDATTDPDTGRAGLDTALRCGLAMAARILADSHRQNEVTFVVPLNPFLSRADTIHLDLTSREATGKVRRLKHALDITDGRATTTVTLALSRPHLTRPAASSAHTPPAYHGIPAISAEVETAHYLELGNHIGGKAGAAAYDEAWSGWIINVPSENKVEGYKTSWGAAAQASAGHVYGSDPAAAWAITSTQEPASVFDGTLANPDYDDTTAYPVQFRVVTPEVETAARDNLDISLSGSYLLRLDEDEFGYTVV